MPARRDAQRAQHCALTPSLNPAALRICVHRGAVVCYLLPVTCYPLPDQSTGCSAGVLLARDGITLRSPFEISGQNSMTSDSVVMPPTNPFENMMPRLPCDASIDWRNALSAALPSTSARTSGAIG